MDVRFRLFGIPVRITPWFWLISLLMASSRSAQPLLLLEWVAVVMVSVLVHELGHAAVVVWKGEEPWIELHGMGGSAFAPRAGTWRGWERVLLALAGPFAGVAFGLTVLVGSWAMPWTLAPEGLLAVVLDDLLVINLGYGLLNLVPLLPLDGGHVLQEVVDGVTGQRHHPATYVFGLLFAVALGALAWGGGVPVLGLVLVWVALSQAGRLRESWGQWRDRKHLPALQALTESKPATPEALEAELARARDLRPRLVSPRHQAVVTAIESWLLVRLDRLDEAAEVVLSGPEHAVLPDVVGAIGAGLVDDERRDAWWERYLHEDANPRLFAWYLVSVGREGRLGELQGVLAQRGALLTPPDLVLAASLLRGTDHLDAAHAVLRWLDAEHGDPFGAYQLASVAVQQGRPDDALRWLQRAVEQGFADRAQLLEDPDLASLHGRADFDALVHRLAPT